MTGEMLKGNNADPTVRAYVKDVIGPYFNIPPDLVCPSMAGTPWNAYVNISSQNINEFARNVIYQRRKSMKSGVDLAVHELGGGTSSDVVKSPDAKAAAKDDGGRKAKEDHLGEAKIKALQKELSKTKAKHAKEISSLKEQHKKEAEESEKKYNDFVANLTKSHRKQVNDLKREMKSMENVHKTFLDSYVEASLDALRSASESPTL